MCLRIDGPTRNKVILSSSCLKAQFLKLMLLVLFIVAWGERRWCMGVTEEVNKFLVVLRYSLD